LGYTDCLNRIRDLLHNELDDRMIGQEEKKETMQEFRLHESDTGSPEVQIALMTQRIKELTDHLREHKKDNASRRGMRKLVGRRARLLRYLKRESKGRYDELTTKLGLPKR